MLLLIVMMGARSSLPSSSSSSSSSNADLCVTCSVATGTVDARFYAGIKRRLDVHHLFFVRLEDRNAFEDGKVGQVSIAFHLLHLGTRSPAAAVRRHRIRTTTSHRTWEGVLPRRTEHLFISHPGTDLHRAVCERRRRVSWRGRDSARANLKDVPMVRGVCRRRSVSVARERASILFRHLVGGGNPPNRLSTVASSRHLLSWGRGSCRGEDRLTGVCSMHLNEPGFCSLL